MTPEHRVDQLLTLELNWTDDDGTTLDLSSGYTANVRVVHVSAPNDLVYSATGTTLAATSPNYILTLSAANLASLVSGWGGTLGTYGDVFRFEPQLTRTSDSEEIPWSGRRITYRLLPAVA